MRLPTNKRDMKKRRVLGQNVRTGRVLMQEVEYCYQAECLDCDKFGKHRQSLTAAINDAKRIFKQTNENRSDDNPLGVYVYVVAEAQDYFQDSGEKIGDVYDCSAYLGTINNDGEYFDMCNPVEFLR